MIVAEYLDDPAARIAATLRAVQRAGDGPALQVWSTALGGGRYADVFVNLGKFMLLVDEAKAALVNVAGDDQEDRAFYLEAFQSLDAIVARLTTHLQHTDMSPFSGYISNERIYILELLSRELRRSYKRSSFTEESRFELLQQVRSLKDAITTSESLSAEEKLYLIQLLDDVERALRSYWLGGFNEVRSTVTAVAAGVAAVSDEPSRGWLMRKFNAMWAFLVSHSDEARALTSAGREAVALVDDINNLT